MSRQLRSIKRRASTETIVAALRRIPIDDPIDDAEVLFNSSVLTLYLTRSVINKNRRTSRDSDFTLMDIFITYSRKSTFKSFYAS